MSIVVRAQIVLTLSEDKRLIVEPTESWQRLIDLLRPFHDQAAATARRLSRSAEDGDDLFQETVIRAYEKLSGLRDESRFRPWFYSVLLSVHRNRSRRGFWRRFLSMERKDGTSIDVAGEDGASWDDERRGAARIARALANLNPEQREAVVLFELDGFSVEEIAALQSASVPAVKSRLSRGRDRLRRHYSRQGFPMQGEQPGRDVPASDTPSILRTKPVCECLKPMGRTTRSAPLPEGETP
ncbi:RNA polymerase sigma factor [Candidatus Eisenbacteria bacterium]|uniref:RNA polymerase sigma factor n=1 Tax=Eiseniibacteriota bacterium TaxID=2212470 RepID=A0ABV6YN40_UNCEI